MPGPTLVTGASGFVGSHLVRRLTESGEDVRVLVRDAARLDLLGSAAGSVEIVTGDVTDFDAVEEVMTGVERVYHCAAYVGFEGRTDRHRLHRVNVRGTALVLEAAARAGVRRLVHTSSIAALGRSVPTSRGACMDESEAWTDSRLNTDYARSKYLAELEVQRAVAEGLNAVIVNPALVFGPGRRGENTMRIAERVFSGKVPAIPSGATGVVDVRDVACGLQAAMDRGATGQRYILVGENLSWQDIIGTLASALRVDPPTRLVSLRTALIMGAISEALAFVARRPSLISRETARAAGHSTCYDNARARSELGLSFTPFHETATLIAEHLRG